MHTDGLYKFSLMKYSESSYTVLKLTEVYTYNPEFYLWCRRSSGKRGRQPAKLLTRTTGRLSRAVRHSSVFTCEFVWAQVSFKYMNSKLSPSDAVDMVEEISACRLNEKTHSKTRRGTNISTGQVRPSETVQCTY